MPVGRTRWWRQLAGEPRSFELGAEPPRRKRTVAGEHESNRRVNVRPSSAVHSSPYVRAAFALCATLLGAPWAVEPLAAQAQPLRVFISVDMEGIGGIGTGKMTNGEGKDYATGRELMTQEVNAVVDAILAHGPAEILVNDSHGDMQNLLHTQLDPRVAYIQGNTKPLGMVQGLTGDFDAAVFLGYHARAGTEGGFLAHTGSGSVKGLWVNDVEVGEGGMNAYYAGAMGVPVILAAGDSVFAEQFNALTGARTVSTKHAIGAQVARLIHPEVVRERLSTGITDALANLGNAQPMQTPQPVNVRMRFATTTRADILQAIPGMSRIDGYTVAYTTDSMDQAYRMIRLMYKYIAW